MTHKTARSSWLNGLLTFVLIAITIAVIRWCVEGQQDKESTLLSIPSQKDERAAQK